MTSSLREYALIGLLIAVAVTGYVLFDSNKEDILSFSLDAIGTRLVDLVEDESAKDRIADAFDQFQIKVANNEVRPEQIEYVAANVLNLAKSNTRISPEEAEFVLAGGVFDEPASLPTPAPPTSNQGFAFEVGSADRAELGKRLESMVLFADAVGESDTTVTHMIHFEAGDAGVHVVLDTEFGMRLDTGTFQDITQSLEASKLLKWESQLKDKRRKIFEMREAESEMLRVLYEEPSVESLSADEKVRLERLAQHAKLQSLGATSYVNVDSINSEIQLIIQSAIMHAERAKEASTFVISVGTDSTKSRN